MDNIETIRTLRQAAQEAMQHFKLTVRDLGSFDYEATLEEVPTVHDNVKVVEASTDKFTFELIKDKYQIVIGLVGKWVLTHGGVEREINPTDIVKVPAGTAVRTIMKAGEKGCKFVYIQFKS